MSDHRTATSEALSVVRAFNDIALNGFVCTPPDTFSDPFMGGDGSGSMFDIEAMKCPECRAVWRRVAKLLQPSPDGSPAHASGCESPDPSPDCPRCAALTRERNEAFDAVGIPRTASLAVLIRHHRNNEAATQGTWKHVAELAEERMDAAERDLAQARRALQQAERYLSYIHPHRDDFHQHKAVLAAAREALVERGTQQTDTGGAQSAPCAGERAAAFTSVLADDSQGEPDDFQTPDDSFGGEQ